MYVSLELCTALRCPRANANIARSNTITICELGSFALTNTIIQGGRCELCFRRYYIRTPRDGRGWEPETSCLLVLPTDAHGRQITI